MKDLFDLDQRADFDNPHDAVQENGTYGGQGKAVDSEPPTALLFEQALKGRSL